MDARNKVILVCLGVLAVGGLGYAFGRYAAPEKVRETQKEVVRTVTVERDTTELKEEVRSLRVQLTRTKQRIRREELAVVHPDGKTETRKTEDITADTVAEERKSEVAQREGRAETVMVADREAVVERVRAVERERPQWRVAPMVGVNLRDLTVGQGLTTGPFVFGLMVERRVLGPLSIGLWGLSSGQVGLGVGIEF